MKKSTGIKPTLKELNNMRYYAKALRCFSNQKSMTLGSGNRVSNSKGKGMDFDEVRHYQPGDDIRLMHWSLTARLGKPFTKVYHEEKDRMFYFIVDQSSTMDFGTKECFKSYKSSMALSLLGFSAISSKERVGGIVFNDNGYNAFPPTSSNKTLFKLFKNITNPSELIANDFNLQKAIELAYQKVSNSAVVVVISDFMEFSAETKKYLRLINRRNNVINIMVYDQLEKNLPNMPNIAFSKGNSRLDINGFNKKTRENYNQIFMDRENDVRDFSKKNGMIFFNLATDDDLVKKINYGMMGNG